jgi:hypothetical protein
MAGALLMSTQPLSDPGGARGPTSTLAGGGQIWLGCGTRELFRGDQRQYRHGSEKTTIYG